MKEHVRKVIDSDEILSKNSFLLQSKSGWLSHEIQNILPFLKEWKVSQLWLAKNQYPKILQEISQIRFPNLKTLVLRYNQIQSIEGMSKMTLSSIQLLCLGQNHINKIKCLRKIYSPKLSDLETRENPIVDYEKLCELELPHKVKNFCVQFYEMDLSYTETFSWIIKMKMRKVNSLCNSLLKKISTDQQKSSKPNSQTAQKGNIKNYIEQENHDLFYSYKLFYSFSPDQKNISISDIERFSS